MYGISHLFRDIDIALIILFPASFSFSISFFSLACKHAHVSALELLFHTSALIYSKRVLKSSHSNHQAALSSISHCSPLLSGFPLNHYHFTRTASAKLTNIQSSFHTPTMGHLAISGDTSVVTTEGCSWHLEGRGQGRC